MGHGAWGMGHGAWGMGHRRKITRAFLVLASPPQSVSPMPFLLTLICC
ncbi:MAG: hypothetical protein KME33_15695 [Aetokthonos hydrillicola CCALA 1050]|nr:hypothetical protein [Aetokthonos hydrillicola CCALA 1050]